MLPKPDKSKKKFPSDGGESIETKEERLAKEKKRLQKKRRLVVISIILTVGLSLSFWSYRSIKKFITQDHKINSRISFSLPNIKISKTKTNNFDSQIQKIISPKFANTSIYIADNSEDHFVWSQNETNIFQQQSLKDIQSHLDNLTATNKSLLGVNLPQGLSFQEIVSDKDSFDYFNQINLPGKKMLILIHSSSSADISTLVESIYWTYIQNSN